uniref:Uncharacterized protein n=1 Tax=Lepeophtheirus salmonis TaxID=72036 RepID=A0A0K2VEK4_LEPSM
MFLNIGPKLFNAFGTRSFLLSNNVSELIGELH